MSRSGDQPSRAELEEALRFAHALSMRTGQRAEQIEALLLSVTRALVEGGALSRDALTAQLAPAAPWAQRARALYDRDYADTYRALYIDHPQWREKHACNLQLLRSLVTPTTRWLDLFCGQAWHFARAPEAALRVGVDLSKAQLERARRASPGAHFVCADALDVVLPTGGFDLVTCFWGGYGYLDDADRIGALLARMIGWTAPGGTLYLELITPETLSAFGATPFADATGSRVDIEQERWSWRYVDPGGEHRLTTPPVTFFEARLRPYFATVERRGLVATMVQLVCAGKETGR